jgi:DNA-binding CsgD family transcriptional regulator
MIHSMILLLVLALAFGLGSIAVAQRHFSLYRLAFIKNLLVFLIALNVATVVGIFFNYFGENLKSMYSPDVYRTVDTGYRLVAHFILLVIGGSLVLMLRSLVDDKPSRNYVRILLSIWGALLVLLLIGVWFSPAASPIPLPILANVALDQLVQYLVFFECIRAWFKSSLLRDPVRRRWSKGFLVLFATVWLCLIFMSFIMLTEQVGERLFSLLSAIFYLIFNALPLLFLGRFLRHAFGVPGQEPGSQTEKLQLLCERYGISNRERDIIQLVCRGYPNKKIADELCISLSTVKDHNHNIFRKLRVTNRTQLVAVFGGTNIISS